MTRTLASGAVLFLLIVGCATTAQRAADGPRAVEVDRARLPEPVTGVEGMEKGLFRDGRVFIGAQPTPASLAVLAKQGVVTVVNLRTPKEMADKAQVPFDEAAETARLGLEYVTIPLNGGDYPYNPQAVEALARVLERVRGPVLLHCRGAVRASYLWAAYLVRYGGLDLDAAVARGRAMGIPADPLGQLLGTPLKLVPAGAQRSHG